MFTQGFLKLSKQERAEFLALKQRLFGTDLFVVLDEKDPDTIRYNELMGRILGG